MTTKQTVFSDLVKPVVKCIERGFVPWLVPEDAETSWRPLSLPLKDNDRPFEGINVLVLWAVSRLKGYRSSYWFTANQAAAAKGVLKHDDEATQLVLFPKGKSQPSLYTVYNAEQIQDLPRRYYANPLEFIRPPTNQVEAVARFIQRLNLLTILSDSPSYIPGPKCFRVPDQRSFKDERSYWSMWLQVLPHYFGDTQPHLGWHQYNRDNPNYVISEMVATLAGSYAASGFGIPARLRPEHERYLGIWADYIARDPEHFFELRKVAANMANHILAGSLPAPQ